MMPCCVPGARSEPRTLNWHLMEETESYSWKRSSPGAQVGVGMWSPLPPHSIASKRRFWVEPFFFWNLPLGQILATSCAQSSYVSIPPPGPLLSPRSRCRQSANASSSWKATKNSTGKPPRAWCLTPTSWGLWWKSTLIPLPRAKLRTSEVSTDGWRGQPGWFSTWQFSLWGREGGRGGGLLQAHPPVGSKWCCRGCANGRTGMTVPRGRWQHSCMKQRVVAGWAVAADATWTCGPATALVLPSRNTAVFWSPL